MRFRELLRVGAIALVCFACTGNQSTAGGQSGTEVAGPCGQWLGGPLGLDEKLPPSLNAGGSSGTGAATARSLLQAVISKASREFNMRWFVPPDCSCHFAHTPLTLSISGDPSGAAIEPEELSCGKQLKIEGISLHLQTADGSLDEVVLGNIQGQVSRGTPPIYEAQFRGFLNPALHGGYDISRVTRQFAEPQIELRYDLRSTLSDGKIGFGSGTIVVRDATEPIREIPIASWYDDGVPIGTVADCQAQGGGGPANQDYTAGTAGLCVQ